MTRDFAPTAAADEGWRLKARVLIADADPAWRAALHQRLTGFGVAVFEVSSALEAIASAVGQAFDAIIMAADDPSDPEAARRMRALPAAAPGPALIGVFASAGPKIASLAEGAGFDGFLSRHTAARDAPHLLALLLRPAPESLDSVRAAEFDDVEQENRGDKGADGEERGHESPQDNKVSDAL